MLSLMHSGTAFYNMGAACNAVQHYECHYECHTHSALDATDSNTVLKFT